MPEEKRESKIPECENVPRKPWQTPVVEELMVDQTLGSEGSLREAIGTKFA
jgi:hypothetical protein